MTRPFFRIGFVSECFLYWRACPFLRTRAWQREGPRSRTVALFMLPEEGSASDKTNSWGLKKYFFW
ncbi:hypothetical protein BOX24_06130 [Leptospirillum ferriphilum]|uniref:Uncharacterized protein n=1 Tax=Leptospirillum ferriphilum TaxID=178606 RepID=A0A1V3SVS1_9BACT|nr:hypothetical protein BOX24_06130 [Leptospirillum ferriphilum]